MHHSHIRSQPPHRSEIRCSPRSFRTLAAIITGTLAGCVSVKTVDRDELPAAWTKALPKSDALPRDPNGVYAASGQGVKSGGEFEPRDLGNVFFPGQRLRATRWELRLDSTSNQLTVTAAAGRNSGTTASFATELDAKTHALSIPKIEVLGTKFGATAETQSARLFIGDDRALYIETKRSGAGVVLFLPAVGYWKNWGRWEVLPP